MQIQSLDQLKRAAADKVRERHILENIKEQHQRSLQYLDKLITELSQEELLLQQEIRYRQHETIREALHPLNADRRSMLIAK